jgi:hypothetical protein
MIGAGDTPSTSKGAAGRASSTPQLRRLLKPKITSISAAADRITPNTSILTSGLGTDGFSLRLSAKSAAA